jgi:hypothetical protein
MVDFTDDHKKQIMQLAQGLGYSAATQGTLAATLTPSEVLTPGQIAQRRLNALKADPAWARRVTSGDQAANEELKSLTTAISVQQRADTAAQLEAMRKKLGVTSPVPEG